MSNQIDITGGARVRNLNGVITGSTGVLSSLPINGANGIPQLDSSGKILVSQLPNSVMEFLGTWNAATNTPTLVNGTGNAGDVYLCTVAGTVDFGAGPIYFSSGDYVVYSGSTWERSSGAMGTVTSVGASITGNAIGLTGSPITTAGTLAFAFAGNAAQYVNGAGNLVTFPTTIAQAQRLITEVYNETGATLTKGTVVYINGGHGNLPTVTKAIATGDSTSAQTYGVVQNDITDNNNGYVVVIGSLGDLDTQAYAAGTQLYLSSTTAGAWTSTKQYAPAHLVYVGIVVRSHPTQGVVEVRIQNGFELDELHNVSAQTPSNNQGLFYNSSNQLWENKSIATALGYTPANQALVVPYTGATTDVDLGIYELQASLLKSTGIVESTLGILTSYGITINKTGQSAGAAAGQMQIYAPSGTSSSISFQDGNTFFASRFNFDNTGNRTYTFPAASGTLALTSNLTNFITLASLSATSPLSYNNTTGNFSIQAANVSQSGYLTATDWNLFTSAYNNMIVSAAVAGTTTKTLTLTQQDGGTITASWTDINTDAVTSVFGRTGAVVAATGDYTTAQVTEIGNLYYTNARARASISLTTTGSSGASSYDNINGIINVPNYTLSGLGGQPQLNGTGFVKASGTTISYDNTAYVPTSRTLTINGVSYDLSADRSWSINSMVYPSAGIAVSTGTAWGTSIVDNSSNWNTAYSLRISSATAPLSISSNVISISQASSTTNGYLSSTDWNTFNNKTSNTGTVTSIATTGPITGGTITGSGTIGITQATTTTNGYLSSTDWNTFNNKQNALTNPVTGTGTTNYLPKFTGTSTIGNSLVYDNGTNVGINISSPAFGGGSGLQINASGNDVRLHLTNSTSGALSTDGYEFAYVLSDMYYDNKENGSHIWYANGGQKMILNSSGNLGLGVTPSAWSTGSTLDISTKGAFHTSGTIGLLVGRNVYYDAGYKYKATGIATSYVMDDGGHSWNIAPSGTAGNPITFTQAMTLTANGRLLLGTTTEASYLLDVNGTGRFSGALSGTSATFSGTSSEPLRVERIIGGTIYGKYSLAISGAGSFSIYDAVADADRLTISSTGAATFSGSITSNSGDIYSTDGTRTNYLGVSTGSNIGIIGMTSNHDLRIITNNTQRLLISSTGAATFSSSITQSASDSRLLGGDTAGRYIISNSDTSAYMAIYGSASATANQIGLITNSLITFNTGSGYAERMRISSTGNVGIGTTSPSTLLHVKNTSGSAVIRADYNGTTTIDMTASSGGNAFISSNTNTIFETGSTPTERMRITSGGNVGIGTTSPQARTDSYYLSGATSNLGDNIVLGVGTDGGTVGTFTQIGLGYHNRNAGNYFPAIIASVVENSSAQNAEGIVFATRSATTGTTRPTERMRITSGGVAQIANSSGTLGTLVGSERLNVNGGIYAYGDITSGGTITFANNVVNYGGNTNYKGATGSGDVTLSNNGSALLVTGPLQKNYGSSIKFVGNGSSSYDVDFLNAGFTTKTVKVLGSVHLETTDSSFVIPRMTTTQRDALNANNKIAGAMIYNTSVGHFQGYNGSGWTNFW